MGLGHLNVTARAPGVDGRDGSCTRVTERPTSKSSQETVQEEMTITNLDTGERRDFHVEVTEKEVGG